MILIYFALIAIPLVALFNWFVLKQSFGTVSSTNWDGIVTILLVFMVLLVFLLSVRLSTEINKGGIKHHFFPFEGREVFIPWQEILECSVKKIKTYGVHGFRLERLSISGPWIIEIKKRDGTVLLLGTQKPKLAQKCIEQYS